MTDQPKASPRKTDQSPSPAATMLGGSDRTVQIAITLLIILVGAGLRFHNLGGDSLWFDEVLTVSVAGSGVEAAFSVRSHPPLYYLLVSWAMTIWNDSEFFVRLPSAIASVFALPLLVALGKSMKRPAAGRWAAALLAFSPFHIRYAHEARHYAWLMTFSLATFLFLHLATTRHRPRWWLAFALATLLNLYTHYGSLLVLATQSVWIGVWMLQQRHTRRPSTIAYPATAAVFIGALYLPWLPKLRLALQWNLGELAGRGARDITSLPVWLNRSFFAFGSMGGWLPYLIAGLCIIGLFALIRARQYRNFTLVALGLISPFLIIAAFEVSRWAFPKYVIFVLPLYLLAAGFGLMIVSRQLTSGINRMTHVSPQVISLLLVVGLLMGGLPQIQREYDRVERDWRGVADYLSQVVDQNDIIITAPLDVPDGFDQGRIALPYYLKPSQLGVQYWSGYSLPADKLESLKSEDADVWAILLDRVTEVEIEDELIETVGKYQGSLYLVHVTGSERSAFGKTVALYEKSIPFAVSPAPQCLLKRDIALLYAMSQEYLVAERTLEEAQAQCPERVGGRYHQFSLVGEIYHGLLDQYLEMGANEDAYEVAENLLQLDNKDAVAWKALTILDLMQMFQDGQAEVKSGAAEPVQVRQFTMPYNGDSGNVLLIHPPASVTFRLTLPAEPAALSFRAAMDPQSWDWGGDGSTFVVLAESESPGSQPVELFRQHISNDDDDRVWHEVIVPLGAYAGETIQLTLMTEPGPNGDTTGDWAGWETPRIVFHQPSP